jgi:DNA-binding transcriptional ArsR family regulator
MKYVIFDDFFAVLGNKQRVKILQYLNRMGGKSVGEISDALSLEQSAVSHNMKRLLECHFVEVEPQGKERIYRINSDTVRPLFNLIDRHVRTYCAKGCTHWE